jgi:hypothetical protein
LTSLSILHTHLRHLGQETGQDLDELLQEAIEARLAVQEHAAKNLEGWTQEELRAAIDEGIASGADSSGPRQRAAGCGGQHATSHASSETPAGESWQGVGTVGGATP